MKPMMLLPPLVFAGLAAMFFLGMQRDDPRALQSTREGGPVPAMTVVEMTGHEGFTVDALADGEVKMVNFWASWCAPCRTEHPQLVAMAEEGVPIYGINYKDEASQAQRMLDDLGNPFAKLVADPSGRTGLDWGVYGVPETYIIDGNGVVVKRYAGPITVKAMDEIIKPLLAELSAQ